MQRTLANKLEIRNYYWTSRKLSYLLSAFTLLLALQQGCKAEVVLREIALGGTKHTYYLFVPEAMSPKLKVPLIILLHGSNRNGQSMIKEWIGIANEQRVILAAPNSDSPIGWSLPIDGPQLLYDLTELLKSQYALDSRRIYLFGHSAGARFALLMSLIESQYFAATAIHAGNLQQQNYFMIPLSIRKIPISIQVGVNDQFSPQNSIRETVNILRDSQFPLQLIEISNHDHNYYEISSRINRSAWEFLSSYQLTEEPKYTNFK
ncbi:MAG: dienelactone hydrolase family protein [Anaerolineae bacterium]|nr:dienelactone hydrolase family protein [Gloeobacterales cyanobacterium ES-bin-313]